MNEEFEQSCHECGTALKFRQAMIGQTGPCFSCGALVTVEAPHSPGVSAQPGSQGSSLTHSSENTSPSNPNKNRRDGSIFLGLGIFFTIMCVVMALSSGFVLKLFVAGPFIGAFGLALLLAPGTVSFGDGLMDAFRSNAVIGRLIWIACGIVGLLASIALYAFLVMD